MIIVLLTLFPEAIRPYLETSILGIAEKKGIVRFHLVNFQDYAKDKRKTVDDRPFGGGPGMVLKPGPIFDAIEDIEKQMGSFRKILLSPRGEVFTQAKARALAKEKKLLLLCGRYEGIDERVFLGFPWEIISLGKFVLSGGEIPALAVIEAVVRLLPGVLGDPASPLKESFSNGDNLDYPHYTRPRVFRGMEVPEVLVSGNHEQVREWRRKESRKLLEKLKGEKKKGEGKKDGS